MSERSNEHAASAPITTEVEIPETDDPAVLRELLRQAREHLRLRESIERLMAENVARTEALLLEARASQRPPALDPAALLDAIADARSRLHAAGEAIDRVEGLLGAATSTPATSLRDASPVVPSPDAAPSPDGGRPGTIDILVHEIHSPALARSLQQHLSGLRGVSRAEVRELAEGMLRITVESATPLSGEALSTWEPQRDRIVRTARPDVLEIELSPGA